MWLQIQNDSLCAWSLLILLTNVLVAYHFRKSYKMYFLEIECKYIHNVTKTKVFRSIYIRDEVLIYYRRLKCIITRFDVYYIQLAWWIMLKIDHMLKKQLVICLYWKETIFEVTGPIAEPLPAYQSVHSKAVGIPLNMKEIISTVVITCKLGTPRCICENMSALLGLSTQW